jgi:hypothetical protein
LASDAPLAVVRRGRRRRRDVDRRALRGLRLLAPARGRTQSSQPPRYADGLVGASRNLRASRAPPRLRAGTAIVLVRHARHGLLRRGRAAQSRRTVVSDVEAIAQDRLGQRNFSFGPLAPASARFRCMLRTEPNSGCEFVQSWRLVRGRCRKAQRLLSKAKFGHWKTNLPIVRWRHGDHRAFVICGQKTLDRSRLRHTVLIRYLILARLSAKYYHRVR